MKIFSKFGNSDTNISDHADSNRHSDNFLKTRLPLLSLLKTHFEIKTSLEHVECAKHQHLKEFPNIKISFSHSKDLGIAAISDAYHSIGVDIEYVGREITPKTKKYFLNKSEAENFQNASNEQLLQMWCLKEASFKAMSSLYIDLEMTKPLVLTDIIIDLELMTFKHESLRDLCGQISIEKTQAFDQQVFLALAWIS